MPSLDDILSDTMLRKANKTATPLPNPVPVPDPGSISEIERKPLWHFLHDSDTLDQITGLTCRVNCMGYMEMTVCKLIKWGPVSVDYRGNTLALPLTKDFCLFSEYIKEGEISKSEAGLWQLPALIDQSFQHVFAYEFSQTGNSSAILPIKLEATKSPLFMETLTEKQNPIACKTGSRTIIQQPPPLRIILCISLVCCKERTDFDPGGMLGGARIYPLTMIFANQSLDKVVSNTKLIRPETTMHTKMTSKAKEWLTGSATDEMLPELGAILFTDNNNPSTYIPPLWPKIFAYYDTDPKPGKYTAVHPISIPAKLPSGDLSDKERVIYGAVKILPSIGKTSLQDVKKMPGQGEFDNCHIAPKMIDRAADTAAPGKGFDRITMAPFCVHDCLHTHWRWSIESKGKSNLGWDGFVPYKKAGAPLVPPNQRVTIELLPTSQPSNPPCGFVYRAEALQSQPGQWHVIMHHGSAYAVSVTDLAMETMHVLQPPPRATGGKVMRENWALFYWGLRFQVVGALSPKPEERVQIIDLNRLREI